MKCPFCGNLTDKVIDTRPGTDDTGIRRRRECLQCGQRYNTWESIVPEELKVVKRNGRVEDFRPEKIRIGIKRACYKCDISDEEIDRMVSEISSSLLHMAPGKNGISSQDIGEMVMQKLRETDAVAYVRFASVYRNFTDASDFVDAVKKIRQ